jgi:hypothetical protein
MKYVDSDGEQLVDFQRNVEFNNRIRNKLDFVPDFLLDVLFPEDAASIAESALLGPQVLETRVISQSAGKLGKLINQVPRLDALSKPSRVPNAGGFIRSFVTKEDQIFYRVFSGANKTGRFLTRVTHKNRLLALEGLALPRGNTAEYIQEVLVPSGTTLQRSRVLPAFGRRGGLEQFELLVTIPNENFGPGVPFQ